MAKEKAKKEIKKKEKVSKKNNEVKEVKKPLSQKKRGKKYQKAVQKVDKNKLYSIEEAVLVLKSAKYVGFDESFEVHVNTKEQLKGEVSLPHGIGKTIKAVVLDDRLLEEIEKGIINFDILVAHPSFMPKLVKLAKILGPKGLMPNPKNGTLTPNTKEAVEKFEKGSLRYKTESKFPILHQSVGKISFENKQIIENIKALILAISKSKINSVFVTTTMGPSVKLNLESI